MAEQIVHDYREADLDEADRALCDYAVKLTLSPGTVGASDLERLRAVGFDDDSLSIAVQVISYFNYINRIADGLGVDSEDWMSPAPGEWQERKAHDFANVEK